MATPKTSITPYELEELAIQYIDECVRHKKETVSHSKGVVKVLDRHIPTIDYFLRIWIPKEGKNTIARATYYNWLSLKPKEGEANYKEHKLKLDTIKRIDDLFKSLATDIVANEGKGIFYAKNKLGMTDKQQTTQIIEQPLFSDDSK